MPNQVQSCRPDVVYNQLGINDCYVWATDNGHHRVSVSAFQENLKEMVDRALTFGAQAVILAVNHDICPPSSGLLAVSSRAESPVGDYNSVIRDVVGLCAIAGSPVSLGDHEVVCETICPFGGNSDHFPADGVHLSEKGHVPHHDTVLIARARVLEDLGLCTLEGS